MTPFVIKRTYDAPRSRVWKAWTDPVELKKWWGPQGAKAHTCKVDLRPGGLFVYGMTLPDGNEVWGRFLYREITPPQRLVFVVSFSDPEGGVTRHPGSPQWPLHMMSTVELTEERPGRTRVSVTWLPHEATDAELRAFEEGRGRLREGWGGTLERLSYHLERG